MYHSQRHYDRDYYPVDSRQEPEPTHERCPACNGEGRIYKLENIRTGVISETLKETYLRLPEDMEEARERRMTICQFSDDICPVCDGDGIIPIDC